jgi:hypothetical protein
MISYFAEASWFSLLFFIIFISLFFLVFADNFRIRIKNAKLNSEIEKQILEYIILAKKHEQVAKGVDQTEIEKTEGFLKFVSQSRDWAFQYIERVQIAIKNFQDIFHPISVKYFEDKSQPMDQVEFGKLFEAYKKLIDELPEEGKNS